MGTKDVFVAAASAFDSTAEVADSNASAFIPDASASVASADASADFDFADLEEFQSGTVGPPTAHDLATCDTVGGHRPPLQLKQKPMLLPLLLLSVSWA